MPQCSPRYSFQSVLLPFLYLATPKITILAIARAFVSEKGEGGIETGYMSYPVRAHGLLWDFEGQALGGRGREDTVQGRRMLELQGIMSWA